MPPPPYASCIVADVAGCCSRIRYSLLSFFCSFASFLGIYRGTQNVVDLPENSEGCFARVGAGGGCFEMHLYYREAGSEKKSPSLVRERISGAERSRRLREVPPFLSP